MGGFWLVAPPVQMIEPVPAQEIYVTGPGGFWYDNGTLMVPCYREETTTETPDEPPQRVVKVKILWPFTSLEPTIEMLKHCRNPTERRQVYPPSNGGPNVHQLR